jgi:protein arginine N-methyltransferase 5
VPSLMASTNAVSLANGISIPSSYTAYLAPLSSSKLYNEIHTGKDDKASETPYVVMFQAVNILSGQGDDDDGGRCGAQIQECWEFEHPRRDVVLDERGRSSRVPHRWEGRFFLHVFPGLPVTNSHNIRSATLTFHIPHAGVLHGLAGYFEAVLYGEIGLSIHPDRKDHVSKDMLSWFPLFFPLKVKHVVAIVPSSPSSKVCNRSRYICRVTRNFKSPYGA